MQEAWNKVYKCYLGQGLIFGYGVSYKIENSLEIRGQYTLEFLLKVKGLFQLFEYRQISDEKSRLWP